MAYGTRNKLAAAAMKSLGSRESVDDATETFASRRFREDQLIPVASTLGGMKMGAPAPSAEIGNKIGKQLREIYDSALHEPLPDRFSEVLNRLEYARD